MTGCANIFLKLPLSFFECKAYNFCMIDYRTFTKINKLLNNFIFVRIDIRKSNRNSSERIFYVLWPG